MFHVIQAHFSLSHTHTHLLFCCIVVWTLTNTRQHSLAPKLRLMSCSSFRNFQFPTGNSIHVNVKVVWLGKLWFFWNLWYIQVNITGVLEVNEKNVSCQPKCHLQTKCNWCRAGMSVHTTFMQPFGIFRCELSQVKGTAPSLLSNSYNVNVAFA